MEKYKFLEHTADVKFQAFGDTMEEAFSNAALALAETMTKGVKVTEKVKWNIDSTGKDYSALLYNFLEEFLFLLDTQHFILSRVVKISINEEELEAEIIGDNAAEYKISNDVKAITYNQMFVKQEVIEGKNKWVCQVVVDV
jgi:SHS2 domain-containing protein